MPLLGPVPKETPWAQVPADDSWSGLHAERATRRRSAERRVRSALRTLRICPSIAAALTAGQPALALTGLTDKRPGLLEGQRGH